MFFNKFIFRGSENPTYLHIKAQKGVVEEDRPIVNFTQCQQIVKDYVAHKVYKPKDLAHREVYAFSYYFDRATEVGLIGTLLFMFLCYSYLKKKKNLLLYCLYFL
jgi:hypothetical protein